MNLPTLARSAFVGILALTQAAIAPVAVLAAENAPAPTKPRQSPTTPGYFRVGFEILASFPFVPPEPGPDTKPDAPPPSAANQIPAKVKALDGSKVIVTGFVLPLKMEKGLVTELLLVRDQQACCFGAAPQINEFVFIKMVGGGVKPLLDTPVEFFGKLTVKEFFEEGFLSHIYLLEAEKMGKATVN